MKPIRPFRVVVAVLVAGGMGLTAHGLHIPAKAWLAQVLLERSWTRALAGEAAPRPWPWADTHAVARLRVPRLGTERIVLAGAHGRSMAFGPGHVDGTALPGAPGHSVVTAHRDTHFAFLRHVAAGDRVEVETVVREPQWYRVVDLRVLDTRRERLVVHPDDDLLTLVTCYPFTDWQPGGPYRYVVTAVPSTGPH